MAGSRVPLLIYLPPSPHQHLERSQQKTQKDSLSPQHPETKFNGSNHIRSKESRGMSSWGHSSRAGPLPSCGLQCAEAGSGCSSLSARVLQMHPSPALLCQEL